MATIPQRRAGDGIRTHDNHVGNVVLYQLSYTRILDLFEGSRQFMQPLTPENPVIIGYRAPVARSYPAFSA